MYIFSLSRVIYIFGMKHTKKGISKYLFYFIKSINNELKRFSFDVIVFSIDRKAALIFECQRFSQHAQNRRNKKMSELGYGHEYQRFLPLYCLGVSTIEKEEKHFFLFFLLNKVQFCSSFTLWNRIFIITWQCFL